MIALSYHVLPPPGPFRVLSRHRQAVNLLFAATGEIISLVTPAVGDGPGAIVVAGELAPAIPPLAAARRWEPKASGHHLAIDMPPSGRHQVTIRSASGRHQVADRSAADHHQISDWSAFVRKRAGLGPGLTPAGDDFLCGYAVALRRAAHPAADELAAALNAIPPGTTTLLSHHFLKWAARGVAPAHHLAWLDATLAGSSPDPAPVLAHGATSGAAWMEGALAALRNHICEEEIHAPL